MNARVQMINGELVLEDPQAIAIMRGVAKYNCSLSLGVQRDRVAHFVRRIAERNLTTDDVVIVLLNVNDPHGGLLAEKLMPGHNWQEYRDRGEVPFARGLAERTGIQEILGTFDKEASEKLRTFVGAAVVVVDYGVAEVLSP